MKTLKKLLILFVSLIGIIYADYGFYGDAFILAGKSAQSSAMGGTDVSSLHGIQSILGNPAGLYGYRDKECYIQFNDLYGLAFQNAVGFSFPHGNYQLGILWNTVGVQLDRRDDVFSQFSSLDERRDYVRDYFSTETFYDLESVLLLSAATSFPLDIKLGWAYDRFTIYMPVGFNVKMIYKSLDKAQAIGAGVDAGVKLLIPGNEIFYIKNLGTISLGMNIQNIAKSPIVWLNNLDDFGNMRMLGGIALLQPFKKLKSHAIINVEGYIYESQFFPEYGRRYGFEWTYQDMVSLRFGKDLSSLTAGVGAIIPLQGQELRIDYSMQYHDIDWSHLLTVSYNWGKKKTIEGSEKK